MKGEEQLAKKRKKMVSYIFITDFAGKKEGKQNVIVDELQYFVRA